jgi:hypothetical protein
VKLKDNPLADLVVTLPDGDKDEGFWIANEIIGRFLPNSRKPRPLLIVIALLDEKHMVLLVIQALAFCHNNIQTGREWTAHPKVDVRSTNVDHASTMQAKWDPDTMVYTDGTYKKAST